MKNRIPFLLVVFFVVAGTARAEDIHIAQTAQGNDDGTSPAHAHAVTWFNTAANWGAGAEKISPGDTVRLGGTITSNLAFQGNGASDNYITLDGTGAILEGAVISEQERSWWRVQNCTWADQFSGWVLMEIRGGSNGVFTKNRADNMAGGAVFLRQWNGLPHDITISHNFFRTAAANFGDVQIDLIACEGAYHVLIEGNHLEMRIVGQSPYNQSHDDIIQTWEKGGSSSGNPHDWTVRYNKLVMNTTETNHRSFFMIESTSGDNFIYGNVFFGKQGAQSTNALSWGSGNTNYWYHNTAVFINGSCAGQRLGLNSTNVVRNNITAVVDGSGGKLLGDSGSDRDYNLWYCPDCWDVPVSCSGRSGCVYGQDPLFSNVAAEDFSLQAASPAVGTGTDLGPGPVLSYVTHSFDHGPAPGATWPDPVLIPRTSWDMGAYVYTTDQIQNPTSQTQIHSTPPLVPNPVKAADLRRLLLMRRGLIVYNIRGALTDIADLNNPGIYYLVDTQKGGTPHKVMVMP